MVVLVFFPLRVCEYLVCVCWGVYLYQMLCFVSRVFVTYTYTSYVYVWRGMAVGEGCGVDLFGGVGEHPWGIYLCLNFVLQEQIKEIIIFLGVLVCVYQ